MFEIEFVILVLGVGVLAVAASRVRAVRRLRHWWLLAMSYCLMLAGWGAATLAVPLSEPVLSLFEHGAYAAGAISAAVWCWLAPRDLAEVA